MQSETYLAQVSGFGFVLTQDGDDDSPILTSSDIVKVPDPQMGMVREIKSLLIKSSKRKCDLKILWMHLLYVR